MNKPLYVGLLGLGLLAAAACGATATPTATPSSPGTTVRPTATPLPRAATPTPTFTAVAPVEGGLCLESNHLGVLPGDTWTIGGPIAQTTTTYTVTGVLDANWVVDGKTVVVENSKIEGLIKSAVLDADGNPLDEQEEEIVRSTISVAAQSPVLTLDWECHAQAWQDPASHQAELSDVTDPHYTVEERTLESGMRVVLFKAIGTVSEQDFQGTVEAAFGYDKTTGRHILLEYTINGTQDGEAIRSETMAGLISEGKVSVDDRGQHTKLEWLNKLITELENRPASNPPLSITEYRYKEEMVYYQSAPCCDFFSILYDRAGNVMGYPDGGITGRGDGSLPDFAEERIDGELVWMDDRQYDPTLVQVLAPVTIRGLRSSGPSPVELSFSVSVMVGLPNACHTFAGYVIRRSETSVGVEVFNYKPVDNTVACAEVYGTHELDISLGSDYDPDTTYTLDVNGQKGEFTGDGDRVSLGPTIIDLQPGTPIKVPAPR